MPVAAVRFPATFCRSTSAAPDAKCQILATSVPIGVGPQRQFTPKEAGSASAQLSEKAARGCGSHEDAYRRDETMEHIFDQLRHSTSLSYQYSDT